MYTNSTNLNTAAYCANFFSGFKFAIPGSPEDGCKQVTYGGSLVFMPPIDTSALSVNQTGAALTGFDWIVMCCADLRAEPASTIVLWYWRDRSSYCLPGNSSTAVRLIHVLLILPRPLRRWLYLRHYQALIGGQILRVMGQMWLAEFLDRYENKSSSVIFSPQVNVSSPKWSKWHLLNTIQWSNIFWGLNLCQ